MKTFSKWRANKKARKPRIVIIAIILTYTIIIFSIIIYKLNTSEWFTARTNNNNNNNNFIYTCAILFSKRFPFPLICR